MTSPDTSRVDAYAAHEPGASLTSFDYEPDVLGPHDVEIEITHCGICHSDLHLIDNDWQSSAYPLVPGHEIVGTIAQRGALITHVDVGERVRMVRTWRREPLRQYRRDLCRSSRRLCRSHSSRRAFRICDSGRAELRTRGTVALWRNHGLFAVIGIGGLGHLAIRFARAMGCEVTAFSSTAAKEEEARAHGAHHFVSSIDDTALKGQRESLDLVISTVNSPLNWNRYVSALRPNGVLSFVGALAEPVTIHTGMLMARRRSVTSSPIGGRSTMREMLDFAARHTIGAQVETLPMSEVNAALDRLRRNDVRYRFVLRRD